MNNDVSIKLDSIDDIEAEVYGVVDEVSLLDEKMVDHVMNSSTPKTKSRPEAKKAKWDKFDAEKIGNGLDVIMGIRPGDLRLVDTKEKDTTVVAKVEVIEALGNETIVYSNLDLDAAQTLEKSSTSITLSAKLKTNPARHSYIFLDIDEGCIHLFDKTTEESIRK